MAYQPKQQFAARINFQIKAPEVRLIGFDGTNLGVVKIKDALLMAREIDLDLVEINAKTSPPLCKITSIGKLKYEDKKKQSQLKKNTAVSDLKEIQLRVATADNDLLTKARHAQEFLKEGHRVKLSVKFKSGRELSHISLGFDQLNKIAGLIGENITIIHPAKADGKIVSMTIGKGK